MLNRRHILAGAAALAAAPRGAFAQAKTELTISRQPGILYMPLHVIEKNQLIEKHAEALGIKGAALKWLSFSNGGAQQDALISGNVDIVNTGTGQLLLLNDRTKGGVKGIVASSASPLKFVSRDPRIKSLGDIGPGDRIAVPTVKISTQAILLQMAAAQMFGPDQWARFDANTVQLGHPDAYVALKNPTHEVRSHFGAPPYDYYELKEVPDAHQVTTSAEIIGGPLSQGQFFTTTKFADANPKWIEAVRKAAEEAKALIEGDLKAGVEAYKEINNDKTPTETLVDLMKQPGMADFNLYPQGTMKFAAHLHKVGSLKAMPASWKDYYLPIAHDMPGN
ncbi:ABC transporter substrate-binding protein [Alsobacter metallidurans]|uniref:ABC transporter substrate-binding protein n=1 Tax=Alsobacter metallidurans TaxID=340221 RepID=A0A917MGL8_9HYPH|nr:ABC transporter substrate-binding protein [Alsobacter metallidurans]GGH09816.1 ABC transporter substrate-binding protein [Alsobacter metallidurans]